MVIFLSQNIIFSFISQKKIIFEKFCTITRLPTKLKMVNLQRHTQAFPIFEKKLFFRISYFLHFLHFLNFYKFFIFYSFFSKTPAFSVVFLKKNFFRISQNFFYMPIKRNPKNSKNTSRNR